MKTKLLIEQHFHGCFGIDFNKATIDDILYLSKEIMKYGIGGIFPTIVTDTVENTKRAISIIKEAASKQTPDMAKILGLHLEGIFINPEKKGIHNPKHFLCPTVENYKLIEDDFIKIVTIAPELDNGLINYLKEKNIKIQAGHCLGGDLKGCHGVTHLFNAMSGISHRGKSTALSALINDDIYTEIIADGIHLSDDALKLAFKSKPTDKIILISDCLPCTATSPRPLREREQLCERSEVTNAGEGFVFADEKVFFDGQKATSKDGTLAGSTTLLPDILKRLASVGLFNPEYINNPYKYHNIDLNGSIEWDKDWNIIDVKR